MARINKFCKYMLDTRQWVITKKILHNKMWMKYFTHTKHTKRITLQHQPALAS